MDSAMRSIEESLLRASLPSTTSRIMCIVWSRLLLLLEGDPLVVPREVRRPCPGFHGTPSRGEVGLPMSPRLGDSRGLMIGDDSSLGVVTALAIGLAGDSSSA